MTDGTTEVMADQTHSARIGSLFSAAGLTPAPAVVAEIRGADPVLPCAYPVGEAAAAVLAAVGVAAATVWHDRTGMAQPVSVDVVRAAAAIHAHRLQRLDGRPVENVPWKPVVGYERCADGRWVELCGPFPHLIDGTLGVLGCTNQADDITAAVARWPSAELEEALAAAGQCGVVARTAEEWQAHPQGRAVSSLGPVSVERIGDSPPEPFTPGGPAPMAGIGVLDLTRILAGPVQGRHLADLGADVLLVNSPKLINVKDSLVETGHGKRSALLDLDDPGDQATLRNLVPGADVFADGYRAGALEARGFGADDLAALRPGIISVSMSCYGDIGPWRSRRGFEPIAQAATGIATTLGGTGKPEGLPGTVCDYMTGCLAALGTIAALRRRAVEGGSYRVRVSLSQTAMWLESLGAVCDPARSRGLGDLSSWTVSETTAYGHLEHLLPPIELGATPLYWRRTAVPPGTDAPIWAPVR
ncbi:MAG: CoA transferase [Acidimicrobiales bacterium]|nr:CoA transferase [Acidimicrobiales bacterium]